MPNHAQQESQILDAEGLALTTQTRKPGIDALSDADLGAAIEALKARTGADAAADQLPYFRSALRRAMEERRARTSGKPVADKPAKPAAKRAATRTAKTRSTAAGRRGAARTAAPKAPAASAPASASAVAAPVSEVEAPASAMIAQEGPAKRSRKTQADTLTAISDKKAHAAAVSEKLEKRIAKAEAKAREKVMAKAADKAVKKAAKEAKAAEKVAKATAKAARKASQAEG